MPTAAQDVDYQTGDFTGYRVLVTGASGVLGSGVAQALRNAGAQVTVLQRSASGLDGVHEIRGSVTDAEAVTRAVADVDSVIHIAAKVSVSGPLEAYEEVNVEGTRTLLTAAHRRVFLDGFISHRRPWLTVVTRSLVKELVRPILTLRAGIMLRLRQPENGLHLQRIPTTSGS